MHGVGSPRYSDNKTTVAVIHMGRSAFSRSAYKSSSTDRCHINSWSESGMAAKCVTTWNFCELGMDTKIKSHCTSQGSSSSFAVSWHEMLCETETAITPAINRDQRESAWVYMLAYLLSLSFSSEKSWVDENAEFKFWVELSHSDGTSRSGNQLLSLGCELSWSKCWFEVLASTLTQILRSVGLLD